MVEDFHKKFGHTKYKNAVPEMLILLRANLIKEEYEEVTDALENLFIVDKQPVRREALSDCVDGFCDLIFVVLGTALVLGIDMEKAMERVYRSNMTKLGADGKPLYREDGKIIKGPNYVPPNFEGCF